jgi:hypothetical protein
MFAFWTVLAAVDRDWSRALPPAILFVGFTVHVLLARTRRSNAATVVLAATIACVLVVSILLQTWFMAVVMGTGLLVMAGIWGSALWSRKPERVVDDAS